MQKKLLLLEDVDGLGRKGDIVTARPGYTRNYLLPQKLVVIADPQTLRMQTRLKEERQKQAVIDKKESEEQAAKIEGITLSITVKVDHDGHMYGSVSALDIINLVQEQQKVELERRSVQLHHPIKETGVHTIKFKLKEGVTAACTLKVVPEEVERQQLVAAPASEEHKEKKEKRKRKEKEPQAEE